MSPLDADVTRRQASTIMRNEDVHGLRTLGLIVDGLLESERPHSVVTQRSHSRED